MKRAFLIVSVLIIIGTSAQADTWIFADKETEGDIATIWYITDGSTQSASVILARNGDFFHISNPDVLTISVIDRAVAVILKNGIIHTWIRNGSDWIHEIENKKDNKYKKCNAVDVKITIGPAIFRFVTSR
jgi:hypothetical protein